MSNRHFLISKLYLSGIEISVTDFYFPEEAFSKLYLSGIEIFLPTSVVGKFVRLQIVP